MGWYTGHAVFDTVVTIGLIFAAITIVSGFFGQSPYGRFASDDWGGININPKLGWWLMEIPATVVFLFFFIKNFDGWNGITLFLGAIWVLHYGNRGWFFPLSIRTVPGKKASFSLLVMALGIFVTGIHGYMNATWFTEYGPHFHSNAWFVDPRFIIGLIIYACGFVLIVHSEYVVRNLRPKHPKPGQISDYKIPYGGGFRFVSSPQYLGEMLAWLGLAVFSWGLPGVIILLITVGNLAPRAFATHSWYKEKFPDYPSNRKALIPYVL